MHKPHEIDKDDLAESDISVGPDGRVYFHDLDRDLIEVALVINPADKLMRRRLAMCLEQRKPLSKESC